MSQVCRSCSSSQRAFVMGSSSDGLVDSSIGVGAGTGVTARAPATRSDVRGDWSRSPGAALGWARWSGTGGVEDGLDLDGETDLLAEGDTATVEGHVERDAEVAAVELAGGREADSGVAERGAGLEAVHLELERHRPGDAVEGQIPVDDQVVTVVANAGRLVGHGGVAFDLEEVGRADVGVAVGVGGVDRRRVNGGADRGPQRIGAGDDLALEVGEAASDLAHHEVADRERDLGVGLVDGPGAGDVAGDVGDDGGHGSLLYLSPKLLNSRVS